MSVVKIGMSNKKWVFCEEYEDCSCTYLSLKAKDLPGFCLIHKNKVKDKKKLSGNGFEHFQFGLCRKGEMRRR